jgi:lipoic acid synthetase
VTIPEFLIKKVPKQKNIQKIRSLLDDCKLNTVCESAKCPNIGECFSKKTLTFMILGDTCCRHCRFCGVKKGALYPPDPNEPERIAKACVKLALDFVVVTSVTRDDLPDGGAGHFAEVIKTIRSLLPDIKIEALIPDFQGSDEALKIVLDANPFALNHNIETVPRLYSVIRPEANYAQSLKVLIKTKEKKDDIYTKSGFMVGLGEERQEVSSVLKDLKSAGCDIVTIGQYLPPTRSHPKAERYVHPDEFKEYSAFGHSLGIPKVISGPFVRSSYRAHEAVQILP